MRNNNKRNPALAYINRYQWSILWATFMFVVMILPAQNLSVTPKVVGFDKLAHCGTFFVLATLLYWQNLLNHDFEVNKWKSILKVTISTFIFAAITELAQLYISSSRTADVWDFFADAMGVGMATFAYLLFICKRV